jgi:hypothetical protein
VTGEIQVYGSDGLFFLTSIFYQLKTSIEKTERGAGITAAAFVTTFYIINTDF